MGESKSMKTVMSACRAYASDIDVQFSLIDTIASDLDTLAAAREAAKQVREAVIVDYLHDCGNHDDAELLASLLIALLKDTHANRG